MNTFEEKYSQHKPLPKGITKFIKFFVMNHCGKEDMELEFIINRAIQLLIERGLLETEDEITVSYEQIYGHQRPVDIDIENDDDKGCFYDVNSISNVSIEGNNLIISEKDGRRTIRPFKDSKKLKETYDMFYEAIH